LKAEYSQPLCAAVQIGLVDLLASWNIHPIAVIGHSSGEMVAAYAAKSITAETAITIAYYRGQASGSLERTGGMASIGLSRDSTLQYMEDGVVLACENSLQSVVVSGDEDALVRVLERVKEAHPDTFTGRLEVETAYHSRMLHWPVIVINGPFHVILLLVSVLVRLTRKQIIWHMWGPHWKRCFTIAFHSVRRKSLSTLPFTAGCLPSMITLMLNIGG
jgi:malonyl CoA-acyl carrier protein transacylase